MTKFLYDIGRRSARHPFRVLGAWVLVAAAAMMLNQSIGGPTNDEFTIPGSESQAAFDLLEERFPEETGAGSRIVLHTEDGTLAAPATRATIDASLSELRDAPHVLDVTDPFDPRGPTISPDGSIGFADVSYDTDEIGATEVDAAEVALEPIRDAGVQVEHSGALVWANEEAAGGSEMLGIGIAVIVLLVAFGSVIAMGIPIGAAIFGVLIGMALLGVLAGLTDVPEVSPMIATMIGLGVGIDYALFVVTRHRELLHEGWSVHDAAAKANATAGQAVLFAGATVVVAISGLQVSGIPAVAIMGYSSAIVVAVAMLLAVTLLPALLGMAGTKIDTLRLPRMRRRQTRTAAAPHETASGRWAHRVARRPWPYALGSLALLVLLAAPVTSLRVGFPDDSNAAPDTTQRQSYDLLTEGFGAGFNSSFVIAVDLAGDERDPATLVAVHDALAADSGIASVDEPVVNPAGDTAIVSATPSSAPQDAETDETVDRLRADVLPSLMVGTGSSAYVTGDAAMMADVSDKLVERLPWFIGAVLLVSFLLLVIVFRSILVPFKAAIMNLLSIGASYGVIVAVFQWGWGSGLLGVHESIPVSPFIPMIMFAILFGLSMDYEVFLLSRVREQFLRHGDSRRSVVEGLSSTARVITSSALIMISVFGAFMLSPELELKTFGLGLSTAVIIDATLVRLILVPATMSLLGSANWWLPSWLDKRLPHLELDAELHEPPADPEWPEAPDPDVEDERELVTVGA